MYNWNNDIRGLLSEPQMPEVRVEAAPIPQAMPQAPQSEGIGIGDVLKGIAYGFVPNTMSAIKQLGQARGARRAAVGQEGAAKYNQLAEYWAQQGDPEKAQQYAQLAQAVKPRMKEAFSREVGINPNTGEAELAVVYRDGTIEWTGVKPQAGGGRAATASAAPGKLPVGMMWDEGSGRAVPIPGVPQKAAAATRAGIPMPSEAIAANQKILQQMYGTPPKGMRWNSRGEAMPIPMAAPAGGQIADEGKIAVVDQALSTIRNLKNAPGLNKAVGIGSAFPTIPGGQAANFETDLEVLKSQTFLPQIEKMRGMGALSDQESKTLKQAVGNLDTRQSSDQFRKRLKEIEDTLSNARARMTGKPAKQEPQQPVRRYNPATGRIE